MKAGTDRGCGYEKKNDCQETGNRRLCDELKERVFAARLHYTESSKAADTTQAYYFPQHCLYFLPLPQGHGSLRPTFGPVRLGFGFETSSAAWLTISLALDWSAGACPPNDVVASWRVSRGALRRKFSNAIRLDALRKMLWQISVLMFTINSSNTLN